MIKFKPELSFGTLREANIKRLPQFKNSLGFFANTEPDGSDWTPAQWLQALIGEIGEYANVRKKFERGDINEIEFKKMAENELADVQNYLDILAFRLGIDLGEATKQKFNEVSDRIGSSIYLGDSDNCYERE
jgi:NTP pyrophosphatase (non-canonical NTP hydrolase)